MAVRSKIKLRKNDEVLVIAGKHKGETGKVLSVDARANRITIDKINLVKKHQKPTQTNTEGGIKEKEAPLHISNVMIKERGKSGKASKIGYQIDDKGKKQRIARRTQKAI